MLKAVFDTNIIVSSFLSELGFPHKIVELSIEGKITNHTSPDMLKELIKVLKEDLKFSEEDIKSSVDFVIGYSIPINPTERVEAVKDDSKDNIILECALACSADYIVSGDRHLLALKEYSGIKIVKPADFFKIIS